MLDYTSTINDKTMNVYGRCPSQLSELSCRSNGSQHAMEPYVGSESRFLLTPPAFDASVIGYSECCYSINCIVWCLVWKN